MKDNITTMTDAGLHEAMEREITELSNASISTPMFVYGVYYIAKKYRLELRHRDIQRARDRVAVLEDAISSYLDYNAEDPFSIWNDPTALRAAYRGENPRGVGTTDAF